MVGLHVQVWCRPAKGDVHWRTKPAERLPHRRGGGGEEVEGEEVSGRRRRVLRYPVYSCRQLFLQLKGDMCLKIVEKGVHKDVPIQEGEVIIL